MKTVAHDTWSYVTGYNFESLIQNVSRIGGIAAFFVTVAGLAYVAIIL